MAKPGNTGFSRIVKATGYSWQGFKAAWQYESAFRQESLLCLVLTPIAFVVGKGVTEIALLILVLGMVLITELINSAIEAIVDRISDEHHPLAGRAKDLGSAAVFVSLTIVVLVWGWVGINNHLL